MRLRTRQKQTGRAGVGATGSRVRDARSARQRPTDGVSGDDFLEWFGLFTLFGGSGGDTVHHFAGRARRLSSATAPGGYSVVADQSRLQIVNDTVAHFCSREC
jgi:hypothetical protein